MEEENLDEKIIYNPASTDTKTVGAEPVIDKTSRPETPDSTDNPDKIVYNPGILGPDITEDNKVKIDLDDYKGYLGQDIYMPEEGGVETLNKSRADNQSWYGQAANMVGQAVVGEIIGGTIEGLGYLLDVSSMADIAKGQEAEWSNWFSDAGKSLREWSKSSMPIYQKNEGSFDMSDSGWWFGNGVSVASSLSMMIPSMAATRALSFLGNATSKGLGFISKSLDIASKMGKQQRWMSQGITQAIVSRHIENTMEASGTFDSAKADYLNKFNPKTGEKFTEEEATKLASDAAASNYKLGWAMLAQDIPQYLALGKIFNPQTMKMENALTKATKAGKKVNMKPWQSKAVQSGKAGGLTFASEGAEESYQYYIAERGKLLSDLKSGLISQEEYNEQLSSKIGDSEMMSSAFWGGLGGNIFQAAGRPVNQLFKSNSQKLYEDNYAERQVEFLKSRGESFALMQQELAAADQSDDTDRRATVLNGMMLNMTVEAISLDKYDQHIESLQNMMSMTQEEGEAFAKEQGVELNVDLFKQYIPAAIQTAAKARKRYMTHLNKNAPQVAAKMAYNDITIDEVNNTITANDKTRADIQARINFYSNLSSQFTSTNEDKNRIKAIKVANKVYEQARRSKPKRESDFIQKLIEANEKKMEALEKNIEGYKNIKKLPVEIEAEKENLDGYRNAMDEMLEPQIENEILKGKIAILNNENRYLASPAHKKKMKEDVKKAKLNSIKTKEDVQIVKDNLKNNTEMDAKDKANLEKEISDIENRIDVENRGKTAEAKKASHASEIEQKVNKNREDSAILDNSNISKVDDSFEDVFSEEESDLTSPILDKKDEVSDNKAKSFGTIKALQVGSEEYTEWSENGRSKIGTEITYELGDPVNSFAKDAIEKFKAGNIDESVYYSLPIKVVVSHEANIYTFIPAYTKNNEFFVNNELPQRKIIIDRMMKGDVKSTIVGETGGDLVLDDDPNAPIPENNIMELKQFSGMTVDDIEILLTNEDGVLVNKDKEASSDFKGTVLNVTNVQDESGAPIPYKGGVFLNVKRADGSKFPLRLNIAKHTREQAETIADLLIEVAVKKSIKYETPLSFLEEKLQNRIKENHSAELEVLGSDPKVSEIVGLFTYVSEQTKGLNSELFMSGKWLRFAGQKIDEGVADAGRLALVQFLQNTKKRQFNIKMWNENPKYRDYMVDNKIISTNATVTESLFQSTDNRKISLYIKRLTPLTEEANPVQEVKSNPNVIKTTGDADFDGRVAKSGKVGIERDEYNPRGGLTGYYYKKGGGARAITGSTKAEIASKIKALYDAEGVTVKSITPELAKEDKNVVSSSNIEQATTNAVEQANKKKKIVSSKTKPKATASPFGNPKVLKETKGGLIKKKCK